jgi:hypothetical protein
VLLNKGVEGAAASASFLAGLDMDCDVRPGKFEPDVRFKVIGEIMGLFHRDIAGHVDAHETKGTTADKFSLMMRNAVDNLRNLPIPAPIMLPPERPSGNTGKFAPILKSD